MGMRDTDRERLAQYRSSLDGNQLMEPTESEPPLILALLGGHRLTIQDIKGGMTREFGDEEAPRPWLAEGVLFVVEWEGRGQRCTSAWFGRSCRTAAAQGGAGHHQGGAAG